MASYLSVVERAYHGTVEEQDDTVLWVSHMIKKAGGDIDVLLRANAVNYAVKGQDASGLGFGKMKLNVPPRIDHDVEELLQAGVKVWVVRDDLRRRGIDESQLVGGVTLVDRHAVAGLFDAHDQVWHW